MKYASKERAHKQRLDSQISLLVGRKSQRLYGIEVDVHSQNIKEVRLQVLRQVHTAIDEALAQIRDPGRVRNYHAAEEALKATEADVSQQIATALV